MSLIVLLFAFLVSCLHACHGHPNPPFQTLMLSISFFSYDASGGRAMQLHRKYVIQLGCDDRVVK